LRAVAATRSLDASVKQGLGRPLPEVEAAWLAYVRRTPVNVPKVVESSPANGSRGVPTTLTEIAVNFDVEMVPDICVLTPCKEGICFDHARWTTGRTLAIAIDRPLFPAHVYQLSLGTPSCRLQSRAGAELPVTEWRFETQ
jgi:Bacterial Ig-like domain